MDTFKVRDLRQKGFFIVDNEATDEMLRLIGASAYSVYSILCRHADKNGESFPSQEVIAEKAGLHRDTVIEKIKILEDYNMIRVEQTKEEGTGKWLHNTYTLLDKTVWRKHLHGTHVDKTSTRVEADTVSTNSDTNNTHILKRPIEKIFSSKETTNKTQANINTNLLDNLQAKKDKKDRKQGSGWGFNKPSQPRQPYKEFKRGGTFDAKNIY